MWLNREKHCIENLGLERKFYELKMRAGNVREQGLFLCEKVSLIIYGGSLIEKQSRNGASPKNMPIKSEGAVAGFLFTFFSLMLSIITQRNNCINAICSTFGTKVSS